MKESDWKLPYEKLKFIYKNDIISLHKTAIQQ
jgi:hypothetical protein